MQDTFDVHAAPASDAGPLLDFERLDVYRVALQFQALATSIALPSGRRELRDQLDRAALSIVLNTAEAMCPHYLPVLDGHAKRGSCTR
jgi:hypothetical protein